MGWTPDLAVGAWIGNADYTDGRSPASPAAPVWNAFMQFAVPRS
jgi:membrane peptidoglycan carboxypeptidase